MLEPCIDLHVREPGATARPEGSRLFGAPLLHHVGDWPRTPEGSPMLFVAQVNLGDMAVVSASTRSILPGVGMLSFFYDYHVLPRGRDPEDRYRFRVLWTPDLAGCRTIAAPPGAQEIGVEEQPITGVPGWRLPSEVDARFLLGALSENEFLAYTQVAGTLMPPCEHRLLGPADWLGPDARAECSAVASKLWGGGEETTASGAASWRLLWQIGGEPGFAPALGEDCAIYIMIRDQDLADRRFIRSWIALDLA
jgi:hypothetical protein